MEIEKQPLGKEDPAQLPRPRCTAFAGHRRVASGTPTEVGRVVKQLLDKGEREPVLIFDDVSCEQVEIDFRGTVNEVVARLSRGSEHDQTTPNNTPRQGPGRPRLGVIAREITLLPGHWDWLDTQPGGASATLRRLVHNAKRSSHGPDQVRRSQEAVYRFMTVMAGDLPGFEEALRAFYRKDGDRFESLIKSWSKDIRHHLQKLVANCQRDKAEH